MLGAEKRFALIILASLFINAYANLEGWPKGPATTMALNLAEIVKNLLKNIDRDLYWSENINSALVFSEFLIKQKMRHYKYPILDTTIGSLYLDILEKIGSIRSKMIQNFSVHNLEELLQNNLMIASYELRRNQIDTRFEYKTMMRNYSSMIGTGFPKRIFDDLCLLHMRGLELCEQLRRNCISEIKIDVPTFGYRRTHQALQLFFLMHHSCAKFYGTPLSFEILATEHCSQVYREHQIISALHGNDWHELYIEQSAVCGLFGFAEFINPKELEQIIGWESEDECSCIKSHFIADLLPRNCRCTDHKYSISLVLFVNAMLFLI